MGGSHYSWISVSSLSRVAVAGGTGRDKTVLYNGVCQVEPQDKHTQRGFGGQRPLSTMDTGWGVQTSAPFALRGVFESSPCCNCLSAKVSGLVLMECTHATLQHQVGSFRFSQMVPFFLNFNSNRSGWVTTVPLARAYLHRATSQYSNQTC